MVLTNEQRLALDQDGLVPVSIDGVSCVVLRAEVFQRIKQAMLYDDRDLSPEETYPAVLQAWDSAGLQVIDQ